jgi:hypothetical protein
VFLYTDVFQDASGCDQSDQLYRYFLRTLSKEQRTEFERHLSSCESCMSRLIQLSESERVAEQTIMDAGKSDHAYDLVRSKIQEALRRKYGGVSVPPPNRTFRKMIYLNAALLFAIALLIYPAYRSTVLDRQLKQLQHEFNVKQQRDRTTPPEEEPVIPNQPEVSPMLSHAKIYQLHLRRGGEENKIELLFDKVNQSFTLIFAVPPNNFDSYGSRIVRNERVVWESKVPATANKNPQLISVQLSAADLQDGEYTLQILGRSAERQTSFSPYKLMVRSVD